MLEPDTVNLLRQRLASVTRTDGAAARSMPPAFYTSPGFLELEREHLFQKEWICLGHEGEIPSRGDYFTTELVDEPIIVVRDRENQVRILSNVCRHRGNLVAVGTGNRSRFVCSYHGWSYATDGALIAAPFMGSVSGFEKSACRLPELRSEIWHGFVFVNLDGNAAPLTPRLQDLTSHLKNYHQPERQHLFGEEDVWSTNWKCLTENFMEGYHLSATHKRTLHPLTPTKLCEKVPGGEAFTSYKAHYNPSAPTRGPFHSDLSHTEQRTSFLFCIYPSFVASCAPNFTLYLCLRPHTVDRVAIRWGLLGHMDDRTHPDLVAYTELCRAFNAEDREKLETLQRALKSRLFSGGPLAPQDYEGTIWDFYQFMASRLAIDAP